MGQQEGKRDRIIPEFDVALWGYQREQVEHCLHDLTVRLEEALGRLESVNLLHEELCKARMELDQLRLEASRRPSFANRLATIMERAEQLRRDAEQAGAIAPSEAAAARSTG